MPLSLTDPLGLQPSAPFYDGTLGCWTTWDNESSTLRVVSCASYGSGPNSGGGGVASGGGNGGGGGGGTPKAPTQEVTRAPNNRNAFTCGAAAAQKASIAGGLNTLGIGGHGGVGGFLINALGGNVFSGATGLFTGGGSMADVAFGGTRLGVPGGTTNLENGISGVVQNGVARGAFAAISAGGEITTLTGTVSTVGLTAGEYASGVGEVKFAYDFLTYAGSVAGCAAGIIH